MYLFFDTETSGLPRFRRAPAWMLPNWPRAVQLGWVLTDDQGQEVQAKCLTIRPSGFHFAADAVARHGITEAEAFETGSHLHEVLDLFSDDLQRADVLIAHNIQFDRKVMQAEFLREKRKNLFRGGHSSRSSS